MPLFFKLDFIEIKLQVGVAIHIRMSSSCSVNLWVFDYIGQH